MAGIVVRSEFIKKVQPFVCGEGVFKKDAPYCADRPGDIDLGLYNQAGKWLDYLPFYQSDEVQFCKAYVDIYQQSNQLCLDTSEEARQQLGAIIAGMGKKAAAPTGGGPGEQPSADAPPPQIPSYSEIYAMIAKQQWGFPPDQFRRMQPYLREKARRIHDGLRELEALHKKPDADAAAIEEKKVSLIQEVQQTCIENNPDSLRQLNAECATTIGNYDTVKARQKWIVAGVVTFLTGLIAFIKSGRAAKSIEAASAEWKEAGKKYRWYNPMRWLRTIDAFVRAKEAPHTDPTPPAPPAPTAPGGGVTGQAPGPGTPSGAGPVPAFLPDRTGAAEPVPYSLKGTDDVGPMVDQAEAALSNLADAARRIFGPKNPQSANIEAALAITDADPQARLQRLAPIVRSPETTELAQAVTTAFEENFLDRVLPQAAVNMRQAAELAKLGKVVEARELITPLETLARGAEEIRSRLDLLSSKIRDLDRNLQNLTHIPEDGSAKRVQAAIGRIRPTIHDTANILSNVINLIGLLTGGDNVPGFIRVVEQGLKGFDTTTVNALINSVVHMNSFEAMRRGVTITAGNLESQVPIPLEFQHDLFRLLFEVVHNGVKYSDLAKPERTVHISVAAEEETGHIVFRIKDNGVGMSREEVRSVLATPGLRLKPDMAKGTGHGITGTILALAVKNGWQVIYDPAPGEGLEVTVKVKTDDWFRVGDGPSGPASPVSPGSDGTTAGRTSDTAPSAAPKQAFGGITVVGEGTASPGHPPEVAEDAPANSGTMASPLSGIPPYGADPVASGIWTWAFPGWTPAPAFAR